jgi:WD40 repeat protein/GTPase SAR1 family protein/DNA-directed RNA polymerase subunit RPC12/RpoP
MDEDFIYNVSIIGGANDESVAADLANRLEDDGLAVWYQEIGENYDISDPSVYNNIEYNLELSQILILLMSQATFEDEWLSLERLTTIFRNPADSDRRFIPVLIEDVIIPDGLKQFHHIDWRKRNKRAYKKLFEICFDFSLQALREEKKIDPLRAEKILTAHTREISKIRTSQSGQRLVSSALDYKIKVWDVEKKSFVTAFIGHQDYVYGLAITPDGETIVSGSDDMTVRCWSVGNNKCISILRGHKSWVRAVAISPDGRTAVSGSDDKTVRVWDVIRETCLATFTGHRSWVRSVAITDDAKYVISASDDGEVHFWNLETGDAFSEQIYPIGQVSSISAEKVLLTSKHHNLFYIFDIAKKESYRFTGIISNLIESSISVNKSLITYISHFKVMLHDWRKNKDILIFEGHTGQVTQALLTADGKILVSVDENNVACVWEMESGDCLRVFQITDVSLIAAHVREDDSLIITGYKNHKIGFWRLVELHDKTFQKTKEVRYTNAKVLLVGETGVGKTGIARRLVENQFVAEISSDGVWASQMKLSHDVNIPGSEREIWLWDFAGQADYRLIHQLFMDETALAVLIFNPQQENPFEGLGQWDLDIQRAAQRTYRKLLVAGRCDRGGLIVSRKSIDDFSEEREFAEYLETSALTGSGCQELREAIIKNIDWDNIPYTSSPEIFKLLKEQIINLKDEGKVLLRLSELKQQLEMVLPKNSFTFDELNAVIGLLAGPGIIKKLEFGDFVLLQPEIINSYAGAVVRSVRAHIDEIGCIDEDAVLNGNLDYQDLKRLPRLEEDIILRAMHQILVAHSICLRESSGAGVLLVFPSLFKRERPDLGEHPAAFITYKFTGGLEEIYSTLIVRLSHTSAFVKEQLWKFAADFRTQSGKRVGLKMTKEGEGVADITIYFEPNIPDDTKVSFVQYVHEHLRNKGKNISRLRHYVCFECGTPVANQEVVQKKLEEEKKDIVCVNCEKRILLFDLLEEKFTSIESQQQAKLMLRQANTSIDNESRELILLGHAYAIAGEAGQIFRQTSNSDWGIDGEIEFKDSNGKASGHRVYLQLKSGDSYLSKRKSDNQEVFYIKNERHAEYWKAHAYPVMLVIRSSKGEIRWMNATEYLQNHGVENRQIVFQGEAFNAANLIYLRDRILEV